VRRQAELINLAHDAIITADANRVITRWNNGAAEMYGWTAVEAVGRVIHELLRTRSAVSPAEIDGIMLREGRWDGELIHSDRDGREIVAESRQVLVRDSSGAPAGILEINRDVSLRHNAEQALRQTQKLESIAILAGGIAHGFNNLLTAIMGHASLAMAKSPESEHLTAILSVSETAADLTRQLLAYAGKGQFQRRVMDLGRMVVETFDLLRVSVTKNIELVHELHPDPCFVMADPAQIRQILLNLTMNGSEAIGLEEPGTIRFADGRRSVTEGADTPFGFKLRPGDYVWLAVSDTGSGMDQHTIERVFDPFFSTKFMGRGLGLAAVAGIVRTLEGAILVESSIGKGSTFTVLLPGCASAG
jgi:PAS domain S-box-containing protein